MSEKRFGNCFLRLEIVCVRARACDVKAVALSCEWPLMNETSQVVAIVFLTQTSYGPEGLFSVYIVYVYRPRCSEVYCEPPLTSLIDWRPDGGGGGPGGHTC